MAFMNEMEFCKRLLTDAIWEEKKQEAMAETNKRVRKTGVVQRANHEDWVLIHDHERRLIEEWREKRMKDPFRRFGEFFTLRFGVNTAKSFLMNLNLMVFIHIAISTIAVFMCQR